MMKRAVLFICAVVALAGCWRHGPDDGGSDAGPDVPKYEQLDKATAALTIAVASDDQTAQVQISLTGADGSPVLLQDGQEVDVNQLALPEIDIGLYGKAIPGAGSYDVTVNEPEHGVLTTSYAPPAAFTITSTQFDLAGTTLTWNNPDPAAQVHIALSQTTPDGPQSAAFDLASDTGSRAFTDVELAHFVQGFPLTVTVTKSATGAALEGVAKSQVTLSRTREVSLLPTSSP